MQRKKIIYIFIVSLVLGALLALILGYWQYWQDEKWFQSTLSNYQPHYYQTNYKHYFIGEVTIEGGYPYMFICSGFCPPSFNIEIKHYIFGYLRFTSFNIKNYIFDSLIFTGLIFLFIFLVRLFIKLSRKSVLSSSPKQ